MCSKRHAVCAIEGLGSLYGKVVAGPRCVMAGWSVSPYAGWLGNLKMRHGSSDIYLIFQTCAFGLEKRRGGLETRCACVTCRAGCGCATMLHRGG